MISTDTELCLLEASDLTYRADNGRVLVDRVSISVKPGEIVAIAGPNGAGKTTLLRMLAGLIAPTAGSLKLFGRPAERMTPKQRARRIAVAGQHDSPDKRLTVQEYVALGRIPHGDRNAAGPAGDIVAQMLDLVGLARLHRASLGRLSGGELQRAMIARAVCQQPDILFLDEPTNHLDPRARRDVLKLVADLGIATVTVLHDLTLIPGLADRTMLLQSGVDAGSGNTRDVLLPAAVKSVFGVDFHILNHPEEPRTLPVLDVSIDRISGQKHTPTQDKRTLQ